MPKGDREEDTCHRNIWADQVVMRWEVTASEIPRDPPESGQTRAAEGTGGQEGSPQSQLMLHVYYNIFRFSVRHIRSCLL